MSLFLFALGRSSRSNIQGSIRLKLWLSTREDRGLSEEEDMWNEIRQQERIYAVFLDHQLRTDFPVKKLNKMWNERKKKLVYHWQTNPWEWAGEMSKSARTILHQHMIQGDLTDLQVNKSTSYFNHIRYSNYVYCMHVSGGSSALASLVQQVQKRSDQLQSPVWGSQKPWRPMGQRPSLYCWGKWVNTYGTFTFSPNDGN